MAETKWGKEDTAGWDKITWDGKYGKSFGDFIEKFMRYQVGLYATGISQGL